LEPATITTVLGSRVKAAGTNAGPLVDEKQLVLVFFAWRGFPQALVKSEPGRKLGSAKISAFGS
jgi:hypothetical protein